MVGFALREEPEFILPDGENIDQKENEECYKNAPVPVFDCESDPEEIRDAPNIKRGSKAMQRTDFDKSSIQQCTKNTQKGSGPFNYMIFQFFFNNIDS